MKKYLFLLLPVVLFVGNISIGAQDKPDGFASVACSVDGLSTTTGGAGGETVIVDNLTDLKKYATASARYIIIVNGILTTDGYSGRDDNDWVEIKVKSNKTIVGYGDHSALVNIELHMEYVENVIIRNLEIRDSYVSEDGKETDNDAIQCDSCYHIWVDHCLLSHCDDGLIDLRFSCSSVTVSWCHLTNHNKAFGIGWTTNLEWYQTIHHCWIDSTTQRNPSFDCGYGHLYNNYLTDISSYGNYARKYNKMVEQNSYFLRVTNPLQYSDGMAEMYTADNIIKSCSGSKKGNVSTMPFDPSEYYDYELDSAKYIPAIVMTGAGPHAYIGNQYLDDSTSSTYINCLVEGNGSVTPGSFYFNPGQYVTLTAIPDDGWEFSGWSDSRLGTTNPVKVVATDSVAYTAIFTKVGYTVSTAIKEGEGSIVVSPDSTDYQPGTELTITASPEDGYTFDHWDGSITGTSNPTILTVSEDDIDISAYFTATTSAISESILDDKVFCSYISESKVLSVTNNSDEELNVKVYSVKGYCLATKTLSSYGASDILLNDITGGVYIVYLDLNGSIKTERFVAF